LVASLRARAAAARARLDVLSNSLVFRRPTARIEDLARAVDELGQRAERAWGQTLRHCRGLVEAKAAHLESLSPLAILGRGYSLTRRAGEPRWIHAADELAPGDEIVTRFAQGEATSRVEKVRPEA
jgi:exodeoxyribonuclease VII large subunit